MKTKYRILTQILLGGLLLFGLSSCKEFLNRKPLSQVGPTDYFTQDAHVGAAAMAYYDMLPSHGEGWSVGIGNNDNHTDNQAATGASSYRYIPGQARVPNTGGVSMGNVRSINSDINMVVPKVEAGQINGNTELIKHYLGELYFFRAYIYFDRLQSYGDYPIVTEVLPDNQEVLVEESKRQPRNKVARFILEDLDRAIELLKESGWNKQRVTKPVAQLFKSRVALYEASWLTNFKGTPFVPGGPGWPGANKEWNKEFRIDIDAEINFFLDQAMAAAKIVADSHPLVENTGIDAPEFGKFTGFNPYFEMFSDLNLGGYSEVLLWREFSNDLGINNTVSTNIKLGGGTGLTKGLVESFLMADGLPIYASSEYAGDVNLSDVKKKRDGRLQLFLMAPGDMMNPALSPDDPNAFFGIPTILNMPETRDVTGYKSKKYLHYDPQYSPVGGGKLSMSGSITFRAVEAYLNYIEASYMRKGVIDQDAEKYWKKIRTRAKVDPDFQKTINNTDVEREALGDWGAYSNGQLVDATMYNIRRERRNEFISEGMRWMDLKRWKALDQVKNYIIEGFNLWEGDINTKYLKEVEEGEGENKKKVIKSALNEAGEKDANVSAKSDSKYLRPYRVQKENNIFFNGYTWSQALYLTPVSYRELQLNAPDGNAENSNFYQNPYWPLTAEGKAEK